VSENITNELIFSVMQKMQSDMAEMKFDVRDLKVRTTTMEEHLGGSLVALSGVNSRLDRLVDRVERVERRLDLTETK
jgi:hypothetical protein